MADQELFRDDALLARKIARESEVCVVTFVPRTANRTLDRKGFAEDFLRSRGIDAVHMICSEDRWFHEASIFDALAAVRRGVRGYKRVLTYGSSMGGYGAIRFAGLAGADTAMAFSPQFSIQKSVCPFESRWDDEASRISFMPEIEALPKFEGETFLFHDPLDERDAIHARMYAAAYDRVHLIAVPRAGHPCICYMHRAGLLRPTLLKITAGRFDPRRVFPDAAAGYVPQGNAEI